MDQLKKMILASGYIAAHLMSAQVVKIKDSFKLVQQQYGISFEEYSTIIFYLRESTAITGITDKYIYQTTSVVFNNPEKQQSLSVNQIMKILEQ